MNAKRLAELHRQRAAIDLEIARAFEEDSPAAPARTLPRGRKQSRRPYQPKTEPCELDIARARRAAKRAGIPVP